MTRAARLAVVALGLALAGCPWGPEPLPELRDGAPTVDAARLTRVNLDTVFASDLVALPGGRFAVLDGKQLRLHVGAEEGALEQIDGDPAWGAPLRIAKSADGWLLLDAGDRERLSALTWVGQDWTTAELLGPDPDGALDPPLSPTCGLDLGDQVVIGDRFGRIVWVNRADGSVTRIVALDRDDEPMGSITDIIALPGGGWAAVDSLGPYVHLLDAEGRPTGRFGRYGLWAGTMKKPKSIALYGDDIFVVADSALGVVQLFTAEGEFVGLVAVDGEPLRLGHPLAVRRAPDQPHLYYALDADGGSVVRFWLPRETVDAAVDLLGTRYLRMPLVDAERDTVGVGGHNCKQCHDGFLSSVWSGWDLGRESHPVDIAPEKAVPPFFPLRDGEITCDTCHSPHGTVGLDAAIRLEHGDDALELERAHPADTFTRISAENSDICIACHSDNAHQAQVERAGGGDGSAHPTGRELLAALDTVVGEATSGDTATDCLSCHTPHGGTTEPLLRSLDDGALCASCHERQARTRTNHPLGQRPGDDVPRPDRHAKLTLARGGGVLCRTCHQLVGGTGDALLREPANGTMLCLACHDDRKGVPTSRHGRVRGAQGIPCLGCHDVHGGHADQEMLRTRKHASDGDPDGCLGCHGPDGRNRSRTARPGERGHAVPVSAAGMDPVEDCGTCHDAHLADIPKVDACGDCHADQQVEQDRGGHGRAVCVDCHPAHEDAPRARNIKANPISQRCLGCHATIVDAGPETPRVSSYEHPAPVFAPDGERWKPLGKLPLFAPDGSLVPPGTNGDLPCAPCHRVHGPDPDEALTGLRRPEWREPCTACHGAEAMPFYLYFHEPDRR